jgi:hypothetical protein
MSMRTATAVPLGLLLGLLVLSGCGGSPKSVYVTVSGTLGWSGGARTAGSPPYHLMPGTVTLKGAGTTRTVSADASGHFSARVPRGSYVVTATSSHFIVNGAMPTCTAVGGRVDASHDRTGILVLCSGK